MDGVHDHALPPREIVAAGTMRRQGLPLPPPNHSPEPARQAAARQEVQTRASHPRHPDPPRRRRDGPRRRAYDHELAPVPRPRLPRRRGEPRASGEVVRHRERHLEDGSAGSWLVLAGRVGRSDLPDHGRRSRPDRAAEEGTLLRGRPPRAAEVGARVEGPLPGPEDRQAALGPDRPPRLAADRPPPEEQLRLRDAYHRWRAGVRAVRQPRPLLLRHGRPPALAEAAGAAPDEVGMGDRRLAGAAQGPRLHRAGRRRSSGRTERGRSS
jgi:hypothetical protein